MTTYDIKPVVYKTPTGLVEVRLESATSDNTAELDTTGLYQSNDEVILQAYAECIAGGATVSDSVYYAAQVTGSTRNEVIRVIKELGDE